MKVCLGVCAFVFVRVCDGVFVMVCLYVFVFVRVFVPAWMRARVCMCFPVCGGCVRHSVPFACRFAVRVCVCLCACAGWAQLLCATVVLLNKIDLAEPAAEVIQHPVSKHAPRTLPHRMVLTEYSACPRARHSLPCHPWCAHKGALAASNGPHHPM